MKRQKLSIASEMYCNKELEFSLNLRVEIVKDLKLFVDNRLLLVNHIFNDLKMISGKKHQW